MELTGTAYEYTHIMYICTHTRTHCHKHYEDMQGTVTQAYDTMR